MIKRFFIFGVIFIVLAQPLGWAILSSPHQETWRNIGLMFITAGGIIGAWYVPFGVRGPKDGTMVARWLTLNIMGVAGLALGYLSMTTRKDPVLLVLSIVWILNWAVFLFTWARESWRAK